MTGETLRNLLMTAWLLPLLGFAIEIFGGYWGSRKSRAAAWLAVGCIATGFLCSATALVTWGNATHWAVLADHGEETHNNDPSDAPKSEPHGQLASPGDLLTASLVASPAEEPASNHKAQTVYSGTIYRLATFGSLQLSIDYYIDSLTLVMFTMVTFIATCI
ncbi:MAG: NADH-quinone oxidoreductase subunit L, partial [Planctomycetaceae bacterium]